MPPAKKPAPKKAKPAAAKPKPKPKARAKTAPPAPAAKAAAKPRVAPKPAERRSKRTAAARTKDEAARDVAFFDNLGALRDVLAGTVVLTAERLQETMDDAVRRGRMLPVDAQELATTLTAVGKRQLDDLVAEIERRTRNAK